QALSAQHFFGAAPVVINGVVVVAANSAVMGASTGVYALNASSGAVLWQALPTQGFEASPAVVNGVVYAVGFGDATVSPEVNALNAGTGTVLWQALPTHLFQAAPVVVNGVVFVASSGPFMSGTAGGAYAFAASPPTQGSAQGTTGAERLGGGNPSTLPITKC